MEAQKLTLNNRKKNQLSNNEKINFNDGSRCASPFLHF
jgi:hypothetical protein